MSLSYWTSVLPDEQARNVGDAIVETMEWVVQNGVDTLIVNGTDL